jgi:hypothetical protein
MRKLIGLACVFLCAPALSVEITLEPDNFADGADISNAVPGVVLSIEGHPGEPVRSRDGTLGGGPTSGTNNAPTGLRVFGHDFQGYISPPTDWRTIWSQLGNAPILRADFSSSADLVSIQVFANDDDIFRLEAYDSSGVLLTSDSVSLRTAVGTMSVSTPEFDIAYVLAFGIAPEGGGQLDNLRANVAIITTPPDLQPGDEYRLAFITLNRTTALSMSIATYDEFVTAEANTSPQLVGLGTTWQTIGSTSSVSAKIHTDTDDSPAGANGVPIYRLDGQRIADDYDDLWDGSIQNPLYVAQDGTILDTCCGTWTGSAFNGVVVPGSELGAVDQSVVDGAPNATGSNWIQTNPFSADSLQFLYGISDVLTVPRPITVQGGLVQECSTTGGTNVDVSADISRFPTNNTIISVEWFLDGQSEGFGNSLTIFVPLGLHTISAVATTDLLETFSDSVDVEINDTRPPILNVTLTDRFGNSVTSIDPTGMNQIVVNYYASDDCDDEPDVSANGTIPLDQGEILRLQPTNGKVMTASDSISVQVMATDASGNAAESTVTLLAP